MSISLLGAVKAVPWGDVIAAAPSVVQGANALWERVAKKRKKDGEPSVSAPPGASDDVRIAALEQAVTELQKEALASSQLIRTLAEHTTEHVRTRLPKIYTRELVDVIFEQPYCRIGNLVDKGIAQRQAASRYLHDLAALGVLREMPFGKEKLFIHPKLMQLLSRDNNQFQPYA